MIDFTVEELVAQLRAELQSPAMNRRVVQDLRELIAATKGIDTNAIKSFDTGIRVNHNISSWRGSDQAEH